MSSRRNSTRKAAPPPSSSSEEELESSGESENETQLDTSSVEPVNAMQLISNRRQRQYQSSSVEKEDDLEYDLGHLCATDPHTLELRAGKRPGQVELNKLLDETARENVQLLFNRVFKLPTERLSNVPGVIAMLPAPVARFPRQRHIPKEKAQTKWEKYAETKGIEKRKRSKLAYDEVSGEWRRRYGYKRANNGISEWSIVEAKPTDKPGEDPWQQSTKEKRGRVKKQQTQEKQNKGRAEKESRKDTSSNIRNLRADAALLNKKIHSVKRSTASAGVFEKTLKGETAFRSGARRKFKDNFAGGEQEQSMKILNRVVKEPVMNVDHAVNKALGQMKRRQQPKQTRQQPKRK